MPLGDLRDLVEQCAHRGPVDRESRTFVYYKKDSDGFCQLVLARLKGLKKDDQKRALAFLKKKAVLGNVILLIRNRDKFMQTVSRSETRDRSKTFAERPKTNCVITEEQQAICDEHARTTTNESNMYKGRNTLAEVGSGADREALEPRLLC